LHNSSLATADRRPPTADYLPKNDGPKIR